MTRTNLVRNPSFETGITDWSATVGTATHETAPAWSFSGTSVLKVVAAGQTDIATTGGTSGFPVTAGAVYSASAYVNSSAATGIRLYTYWWDVAGTLVSQAYTLTNVAANTPTRILRENIAAPTGAAYVHVQLRVLNAATTLVDGVMLEQATTAGTYFDGSTVNAGYTYAWTATAHASASTEVVGSAATTVAVKHYESGAWVPRTAVPKVYVNGAWVTKRPKRYNGTAWVDLN